LPVVIDVSCIYGLGEGGEEGSGSTASNCVITLNNGTALFLREMNRSLALVCILKVTCLLPSLG
jgi:Ras-related GTP-binding protein C/D